MFRGTIRTLTIVGLVCGGLYLYGEMNAPNMMGSEQKASQMSPLEKGVMGAADLSVKAKDKLELFIDTYKDRSEEEKLLKDEAEKEGIYVTEGFCSDIENYLKASEQTTRSDILFLQKIVEGKDYGSIRDDARDKLERKKGLLDISRHYLDMFEHVKE